MYVLAEGPRGTPAFYAAVAQILPTLAVAVAFGLPSLLGLLGRWIAVNLLTMALILGNFVLMIVGEVRAVQNLGCRVGSCGGEEAYRDAVFGLLGGGTLVTVAVLTALVSASTSAHAGR